MFNANGTTTTTTSNDGWMDGYPQLDLIEHQGRAVVGISFFCNSLLRAAAVDVDVDGTADGDEERVF